MAANGSLIVIQFGASGSEKSVLAQTSLSFGLSRNEIVQASKDTDFNDKIAGKLDASMSFEVLAALNSDESSKEGLKFLQDSILNKTVEEFRIVQVDGSAWDDSQDSNQSQKRMQRLSSLLPQLIV